MIGRVVMDSIVNGQEMYDLCKKMFPICRSITGNGFRQSLGFLREIVPEMRVYEVPSGTQVFDWNVPKEWNIRDAWVDYIDNDGTHKRILDFQETNLRVLGYSVPVDKIVSLEELKKVVYTQPSCPDAIPYVTSYYKERYGFCMSQNEYDALQEGNYHIYIDSELKDGSLTYGELLIPGDTKEEILITSYLCHPSMANNELSGPAVLTYIAKWIMSLERRRYTYRFVINPETIGSITYLSKNFAVLKENVIAGFVLSCVGDDRTYSYISSRYGNTLADKALKTVLNSHYPQYQSYSFLKRGSDERQYNAPGIDLPVCGFCRSKYDTYPEYHTSKDNMELISPDGLYGAYCVMQKMITLFELNHKYKIKCLCEPQLGKRGLYPTVSKKGNYGNTLVMRDLIAYADGTNDLFDIINIINQPVEMVEKVVRTLLDEGSLLEILD